MILIALATGMRYGEILGLSWDDIDFENQTISVSRVFDYHATHEFKRPKTTSSVRTISIDSETLALIRQYKIGAQMKHPDYLFIDNLGGYPWNSSCNRTLKNACKDAGIKTVLFHALRHTHCSILLYKGFDIQYVSKRLGHANTTIIYNTYSHLLDEMNSREDQKIETELKQILH